MAKKRLNKVRTALHNLNADISEEYRARYSQTMQRVVKSKTLFSAAGWQGEDIVRTGRLRRSFRYRVERLSADKYRLFASNTARSKRGYNYPEHVRRGYSPKRRGRDFYGAALFLLSKEDPETWLKNLRLRIQ